MFLSGLPMLADAGVWYAFANSDGMGKSIVFILMLGSMAVWFVMLERGLILYRAQKLSERFAVAFNEQHGLNSMLREGSENPCPVARVYLSGMEQLLDFYGQSMEDAKRNPHRSGPEGLRKLSSAQLNAVQTALEREVSSQVFVIEERIGFLATAVSLSPFMGLFGTVWGVMLAFCGVAAAGSANIQALAPGVAGALLTTVAGLIVAIPSLVGYNLLTQSIRRITVCMDNFTDAFMAHLKLEQLNVPDETPSPVPQNVVRQVPSSAPVYAASAQNTVQRTMPGMSQNAMQNPVQNVPQNFQSVPRYPEDRPAVQMPIQNTMQYNVPQPQQFPQNAPVVSNIQQTFSGMEAPRMEETNR